VGAFLRLSRQQDNAAVDYKSLYSGGFNLDGSGWGQDDDNLGIGYAYLRAALNEHAAITADVQYMKDELTKEDPRQDDPKGWIFSLRLTAEF